MEWVHCNKCYLMPSMKQSRFVITNCAHVYCEACVAKNPDSTTCHVCSAPCRTTLLDSNLPENVMSYFRDPWDSFKQNMKVMDFQRSQSVRLLKHFKKIMPQVQRMMKEFRQLSSEQEKCKAELDRARQKERTLQEMLHRQQMQLEELSTQLVTACRLKSPSHCSPYFISGPAQRKIPDKYSPFKIPGHFDDSCANACFPILRTPLSEQLTPRSGRMVTSTTESTQNTFTNLFRAK